MNLEFEIYNLSLDPESKKGRLLINLSFYRENELITSAPPMKKEVSETTDCRLQTSLRLRHFQPGNYVLRVEVIDEAVSISNYREVIFRVAN